MAAKVVHIVTNEVSGNLMILEDDYGTQVLVQGKICKTKAGKVTSMECHLVGADGEFTLQDFLANRVELTGTGSKTKAK